MKETFQLRWLSALDSGSTRLGVTIMLSDAKRPVTSCGRDGGNQEEA